MTDPYKILGVEPDAGEEEIKNAYRRLARKYHPDNFATDETARSMAEEKMKEINEAYDAIQNSRKNGYSSYGGAGSSSGDYSEHRDLYNRVRASLNYGNIGEAQKLLDSIPGNQRNAEWHFLYGCVCASRNMYFDAVNNIQRACDMDPNNMEYRTALNRIKGGARNYTGGYNTSNSNECSGCDICSSLLCADCLCECCGSDLISCC